MRIEREILQLIDKKLTISSEDNELESSYPIIRNFKEKSSFPSTISIHTQIKLEPVTTQQYILLQQIQYDLYNRNLCGQLYNNSDIPYVAAYKNITLVHNGHFNGGENLQLTTEVGGNVLLVREFFSINEQFEYSVKNPIVAYGGALSSEPLLSIEQSVFWITKSQKAIIRKLNQIALDTSVLLTDTGTVKSVGDLRQISIESIISSGNIKVFAGDITYVSRSYKYLYKDLLEIEFVRSLS